MSSNKSNSYIENIEFEKKVTPFKTVPIPKVSFCQFDEDKKNIQATDTHKSENKSDITGLSQEGYERYLMAKSKAKVKLENDILKSENFNYSATSYDMLKNQLLSRSLPETVTSFPEFRDTKTSNTRKKLDFSHENMVLLQVSPGNCSSYEHQCAEALKSSGSPLKSSDSPQKSSGSPQKLSSSPQKSSGSPEKSSGSPQKSCSVPGCSDHMNPLLYLNALKKTTDEEYDDVLVIESDLRKVKEQMYVDFLTIGRILSLRMDDHLLKMEMFDLLLKLIRQEVGYSKARSEDTCQLM